jgi:hypothetical protein
VNAAWEERYSLNGDTENDGSYKWRSHGSRLTWRSGKADDNLFEYAGP